MADGSHIYYVNLSATEDGGAGTIESPWSALDFNESPLYIVPGDVFKIKGQSNGVCNGLIFAKNFGDGADLITYEAWDIENNGPWRMRITENVNITGGSIIKDGIVDATTKYVTCGADELHFYNSVIKGTYISIGSNCETSCYGSTFIMTSQPTGSFESLGIEGTIHKDCIFSFSGDINVGTTAGFNNCVTNRASLGSFASNCQFSWTPPTWPAWNAIRSAWLYETLTVQDAIEVGSGDYTNYPTGLWGTPRISVGAFDFSLISPSASVSPSSSISPSVSSSISPSVSSSISPSVSPSSSISPSVSPSASVSYSPEPESISIPFVFESKVTLIEVRRTNEEAVINAAIAATKADFDQYNGITLLGADPITGELWEYTTLDIDTASYNGTTHNVIEISLDGGTTIFATVTSRADDIQYYPPRLYYSVTPKLLDGTKEGGDALGVIIGSSAYDIITGIGIQNIAVP